MHTFNALSGASCPAHDCLKATAAKMPHMQCGHMFPLMLWCALHLRLAAGLPCSSSLLFSFVHIFLSLGAPAIWQAPYLCETTHLPSFCFNLHGSSSEGMLRSAGSHARPLLRLLRVHRQAGPLRCFGTASPEQQLEDKLRGSIDGVQHVKVSTSHNLRALMRAAVCS